MLKYRNIFPVISESRFFLQDSDLKRPLITHLPVQIDTCKCAMGAFVYVYADVRWCQGNSVCATLIFLVVVKTRVEFEGTALSILTH